MLDETTLRERLQQLDVPVASDLVDRVRREGRHRKVRVRVIGGVGALAALATGGAVAATALQGGDTDQGASTVTAASPTPTADRLFASPPPDDVNCMAHRAGPTTIDSYDPNLFVLPTGTQLRYAFYGAQRLDPSCAPHRAGAFLRLDGSAVMQGISIDGPDAPSSDQLGYSGGSRGFAGTTLHLAVHGSAAVEYTTDNSTAALANTDVFWTDGRGGQWHARAAGMDGVQAAAFLNAAEFDDSAGAVTSSLADWTTAGPAPTPSVHGVEQSMTAQWTNAEGHDVDLISRAGHVDLDKNAAILPGSSLTTVDGHRAVASHTAQFAVLTWQRTDSTWTTIMVGRGSISEAQAVAQTLRPTEQNDPRLRHSS